MNDNVRLELNFSRRAAKAYLKTGERFGFQDLRSAVEYFLRVGLEKSLSDVLSATFALEDYIRPLVIARESLVYNGYHLDVDKLIQLVALYIADGSPEIRMSIFQELKRIERELTDNISEDEKILYDRAQAMLEAVVALRKAISRTR